MKELEIKAQVDTSIEKEVKKELKLVGTQRKIAGHILWEYNIETNTLSRAKVKTVAHVDIERGSLMRSQVAKNDSCIYIQALNKANAVKKLLKKGYVDITAQ